jgi:hypothetical protein
MRYGRIVKAETELATVSLRSDVVGVWAFHRVVFFFRVSTRGRLKETITVRKETRPDNPVLPLRQFVGHFSNSLIA